MIDVTSRNSRFPGSKIFLDQNFETTKKTLKSRHFETTGQKYRGSDNKHVYTEDCEHKFEGNQKSQKVKQKHKQKYQKQQKQFKFKSANKRNWELKKEGKEIGAQKSKSSGLKHRYQKNEKQETKIIDSIIDSKITSVFLRLKL